MDRIIPTFIVVCLIVLGYIVKLFEMKDLEERFVFTDEYRKKFITLCNNIITRDYFNQEIYRFYWIYYNNSYRMDAICANYQKFILGKSL